MTCCLISAARRSSLILRGYIIECMQVKRRSGHRVYLILVHSHLSVVVHEGDYGPIELGPDCSGSEDELMPFVDLTSKESIDKSLEQLSIFIDSIVQFHADRSIQRKAGRCISV